MNAKCQRLSFFVAVVVISMGEMIAIAHDARSNQNTSARLGETFMIKLGEQAFIEVEALTIAFVAVVEDSRCPADVRCIWEGNARIVTTLSKINNKPVSVELNTSMEFPREGEYLDYRIKLIKLEPYPTTAREIAQSEYRALLVLLKS
jgi:hypothetical protein